MKKELNYFIILAAFTFLILSSCDKDDDEDMSQKDRDFMRQATFINFGEIDAGNIALQHGTESSVKMYGNMMVTDHAAAQNDLLSIAMRYNVQLPDETDQEHKDMAALLMTLNGNVFDSTYLYKMISGHDKAIMLHEDEIRNGNHKDVKHYASAKLATIQHHRAHADSLARALFPL